MTDPATARKVDRTLAVTWGSWGGFGHSGSKGAGWRVVLGFVAVFYIRAEFVDFLRAWLNAKGIRSSVVERVSANTETRPAR